MNPTTKCVTADESKDPEDKKDNRDSPEHVFLLLARLDRLLCPKLGSQAENGLLKISCRGYGGGCQCAQRIESQRFTGEDCNPGRAGIEQPYGCS